MCLYLLRSLYVHKSKPTPLGVLPKTEILEFMDALPLLLPAAI